MPHDELSKYVGNHGGAYTDINGMSKQFTYIDHDKKTKVSTHNGQPEEGWAPQYRDSLIEKILGISASICPEPFSDFTLRGEELKAVKWNETMLRDDGMPISRLVQLKTLLENRAESMRLI